MLEWISALARACGAFLGVKKHRREEQDRAAAYIDRVSVMLAELADELEAKGKSPARCAELAEAIGNLPQVVKKSRSAYGVDNDLLIILTVVMDAPGTFSRTQVESRRLMLDVEDMLRRGQDLSKELDKIRKASGMFKGAAEAIKAL